VSAPADPLVASDDAVPRRRSGEPLTLGDCWRAFVSKPSPKLIGAGIAVAAGLRVGAGHFSLGDVVIAGAIVAAQPVTEWLIHVYLLHARPLKLAGRRVDLPTTREHREHHLAPAELDGVLIPSYGIAIFLPMIALTVWAASFPIHALAGGDRLAGAATGLLTSYLILGAYEWSHFLIHTPYRPSGRYFRSIWRSHRLHHYKNERYWFGVTSNLGDRVLGTFPDQGSVAKSRTARTLGVER
jgi:hypothetical protein